MDGLSGRDGTDGRDGTWIDTAVVNDGGDLLLGLSDGQVLNVGRVVGPPGVGDRGPAGLPGAPGRDGNTILSGPRPPSADDGVEGDFWIDLSTPGFSLHKRDGDGWTLQADLRHIIKPGPVTAVGGGGGGSGGGGKGELQNTRTLPLVNAKAFRKSIPAKHCQQPGTLLSQEDANKYLIKAVQNAMVTVGELPPEFPTDGQLWWCSAEELTDAVHIYLQDFNDDTKSVWTVQPTSPVSLEGIENIRTGLEGDLIELHNKRAAGQEDDIVLTNQDLQTLAQDQTRHDDAITTSISRRHHPAAQQGWRCRSRSDHNEFDERLDALEAQDQDGGDYVEKTGVNKITGEWRIKAGGRTLLKVMKPPRS